MNRITNDNYKKIVYISHQYGGDKLNEEKVAKIINELIKQYSDYLFISPIHAFSYAYMDTDYQCGIEWCMWLLDKCDEMWVYGEWEQSKGCNMEIAYCEEFNIPYVIRNYSKRGEMNEK